jgi:hypothetical protein
MIAVQYLTTMWVVAPSGAGNRNRGVTVARPTAYLFCRYSILDDEDPITPDEEWAMLNEIKGQPIAYRTREPSPDDYDTFLMRPRRKQYAGFTVHTWVVARDIRERERSRHDKRADDVVNDMVPTEEIRHTKFIAIPRLGVFAVDDSISDRTLGAKSAVSRFTAVIEQNVLDTEVVVNFAGTPDDAQRALETWTLDQFSFTVRPFNPTPRKLGEQIHELMIADGVGKLTAIATPVHGADMKDSHEGLIAEAKGLTEEGYGQYGAIGTTPDGLKASLSKPKFTMDKEKNKLAQAQNRTLKVYIPKGNNAEEDEEAIIRALLDLYG